MVEEFFADGGNDDFAGLRGEGLGDCDGRGQMMREHARAGQTDRRQIARCLVDNDGEGGESVVRLFAGSFQQKLFSRGGVTNVSS